MNRKLLLFTFVLLLAGTLAACAAGGGGYYVARTPPPPPAAYGVVGMAPGPAFKGWLETLYDRQLEGEFGSKEEALDAARRVVAGGK